MNVVFSRRVSALPAGLSVEIVESECFVNRLRMQSTATRRTSSCTRRITVPIDVHERFRLEFGSIGIKDLMTADPSLQTSNIVLEHHHSCVGHTYLLFVRVMARLFYRTEKIVFNAYQNCSSRRSTNGLIVVPDSVITCRCALFFSCRSNGHAHVTRMLGCVCLPERDDLR